MTPEEVRKETLDILNELRGKCGLEPIEDFPKGFTGNRYLCPIARALSPICVVGVSKSSIDANSRWAQPPDGLAKLAAILSTETITDQPEEEVERYWYISTEGTVLAEFVYCFDNGAYPDLDLDVAND